MAVRLVFALLVLALLGSTSRAELPAEGSGLHLPYRQAGLDERQAAAHLLDRLTYGPRPGEIDEVVAVGLETWLARQLQGGLPEPELGPALARLDVLAMSNEEILRAFPPPAHVLRQAVQEGAVRAEDRESDPAAFRRTMREYYARKGFRSPRQLAAQLVAQKLLRTVHSENQLHEVLTDFWFNHFNVSLTDGQARYFVLPYERDAIRPNVVGSFRQMLGATARHPAMLLYLDNAMSGAPQGAPTTMDRARGGRSSAVRKGRAPAGLNENYARELLELHTLGVDGGYRQEDVEEVARAFTGWTVLPPNPEVRRRLAERAEQATRLGFRRSGSFLFRADLHDAGAKTLLGRHFPAGGALEEGEAVLDMLAVHPSTARHLAHKLATRFVRDEPPTALVERLAEVWLAGGGDIHAVMEALVESPEFWSRESRGAKIKSAHALAASALRITGARFRPSKALYDWIVRMGEPLYAYPAPTGIPDRGDHWINSGALLNRMNFALSLASGDVEGVEVDLEALDGGREPESSEAALETYAALLLPGRDVGPVVRNLRPIVQDPEFAARVARSAPSLQDPLESPWDEEPATASPATMTPLAQVVGVLLGSPEFQRH